MSAQTASAPKPRRIGTWIDHHLYSIVAGIGRLLRRPGSTLLTVGVIALALALPLGLWATLKNVERLAGEARRSREISVFLDPRLAPAQAHALAERLRRRADVAAVRVRTPDQGLAELRARGLADALDALQTNPLPSVLIVTPGGDDLRLAQSLGTLAEVDVVQHDADWRARLDGWLYFGERLVWVLAALFGLGALLVVGNTVRLDIQTRREEIAVLQLLGATDGFVRRPFLYLGLCYGAAAGALALALLTAAEWALRAPLAQLAQSYGGRFALQGFAPVEVGAIVLGAGLLGWLGAGLVAGHTLRRTRPIED